MPANQTGPERQEIPFRTGRFEHFFGIDPDTLEYHREFVDERDVMEVPYADTVLIEKAKRKMYLISEGKKYRDWTDGCIVVNNTEIKKIWKFVKNGTPIEILP